MAYIGLQMWRNTAVASLIAVPASLVCITAGLHYFLGKKLEHLSQKSYPMAALVVFALSFYGGYQVVTGKLYEADLLFNKFGFGISRTRLPIGAAEWLNSHAPDARLWSDFDNSSTLRFFTSPHRDLPILTNTWAYPPEIGRMTATYRFTGEPFGPIARKYNIGAVSLRLPGAKSLARQLNRAPDWKLVHSEGVNVLFVRSE